MNKATLVEKIAEKTGANRKLAESMINTMVDIIIDELKKGK